MQNLSKVVWETKMESIHQQSSIYAKKIEVETKKQVKINKKSYNF